MGCVSRYFYRFGKRGSTPHKATNLTKNKMTENLLRLIQSPDFSNVLLTKELYKWQDVDHAFFDSLFAFIDRHWKDGKNWGTFDCFRQNLMELPKELEYLYLEKLDCSYTKITDLPELPNLRELYCYHTPLTVLPELPQCQKLYCSYTKITDLPELPNLRELDCSYTPLTVLPELPNLRELYCYHTPLTVLPELPQCQILYCSYTKITDLPELPNLRELYCYHTPLNKETRERMKARGLLV